MERIVETEFKTNLFKNHSIIVLDTCTIDSRLVKQNELEQLGQICAQVHYFTGNDECIDYITDIDDQTILLIIADTLVKQLIPCIHSIVHLQHIFVLGTIHDVWLNNWYKIKGVCRNIQEIHRNLLHSAEQCENDSMPFSCLSVDKDIGSINRDQLEPSFMYTTLFKEIFLEMNHDERSLKRFIKFCRDTLPQSLSTQKLLDEFETTYRPEEAIRWYTRETFIYKILNRGLRLLEANTLIHMGFYIADLHRQIVSLYEQQSLTNGRRAFTVYRGQILSSVDVEQLKQCVGGLMSFNCFLSTSTIQEVPEILAKSVTEPSDNYGILFIINVDPNQTKIQYANVEGLSSFSEAEILFTMHSIFRIHGLTMDPSPSRYCEVQLAAADVDDINLETLRDHFKNIYRFTRPEMRLAYLIRDTHSPITLTSYLDELAFTSDIESTDTLTLNRLKGETYQHTEDYATALEHETSDIKQTILKHSSRDDQIALYHSRLGYLSLRSGKFEQALLSYQTALKIFEKSQSPNYPDLAASYNNIGNVYSAMGDYHQALVSYKAALHMFEKTLPLNHPDLASSHGNIGDLSFRMGDYHQALASYRTALGMRQKSLPPNHPHLAVSHSSIGNVHVVMGEYHQALASYKRVLTMTQKSLPPNHPDLALVHNNIGNVYLVIGEYHQALASYKAALHMFEKTLPPNHPDLASSHGNIGTVYSSMREYHQALASYMVALKIFEKSLPANHPTLGLSYGNIGNVYSAMGEYHQALESHKTASDMFEKSLPPNHPELAASHNNIGNVYLTMGDYHQALASHTTALRMFQQSLPSNHPDLALSHNNIGAACFRLGEYRHALASYRTALDIFEKSLPKNHPYLASSHNNIGAACFRLGDGRQALASYKTALHMFEKSLPANHPDLASSHDKIGNVYIFMEEYHQALASYKIALRMRQEAMLSNYYDLAESLKLVGLLEWLLGYRIEDLTALKSLINILRDAGNNHLGEIQELMKIIGE